MRTSRMSAAEGFSLWYKHLAAQGAVSTCQEAPHLALAGGCGVLRGAELRLEAALLAQRLGQLPLEPVLARLHARNRALSFRRAATLTQANQPPGCML